ncbi:hypothetical protein B0680_03805 [Moraxella pluranimalium]|uniref:Uncharacterized protein n=1 Tax=Moraxella pluranimalium TaxID=470453 RepID=A0A1T0CQR4_9GAMM|nr:hypothetical protein B0680_03805 [Moraxella pluranimalium]
MADIFARIYTKKLHNKSSAPPILMQYHQLAKTDGNQNHLISTQNHYLPTNHRLSFKSIGKFGKFNLKKLIYRWSNLSSCDRIIQVFTADDFADIT